MPTQTQILIGLGIIGLAAIVAKVLGVPIGDIAKVLLSIAGK